MVSVFRVRRVHLPQHVTSAIESHVDAEHPHEAGGFLDCVENGDQLVATGHVPLRNDADRPRKRFLATVDDTVPPEPRIFYHSHTTPATVSGLTGIDRQEIPERYAMVVFAPHGEPYSYRLFERTLFRWREVPIGQGGTDAETWVPLPRMA